MARLERASWWYDRAFTILSLLAEGGVVPEAEYRAIRPSRHS